MAKLPQLASLGLVWASDSEESFIILSTIKWKKAEWMQDMQLGLSWVYKGALYICPVGIWDDFKNGLVSKSTHRENDISFGWFRNLSNLLPQRGSRLTNLGCPITEIIIPKAQSMASHFAPSTFEPFPLSQFLINQMFMALRLQTHSLKWWTKSLLTFELETDRQSLDQTSKLPPAEEDQYWGFWGEGYMRTRLEIVLTLQGPVDTKAGYFSN